jgi:glucosylceramidase
MVFRLSSSLGVVSVSILAFAACSGSGTPSGAGGATAGLGGSSAGGNGNPSTGGSNLQGSGGTNTATGGGGGTQGGANSGASGGAASGAGGDATSSGGSVTEASGGSASATGGTDAGTGGAASVPEPTLITSAPNAYWKTSELKPGTGTATITVNDTQVLGEWRGFGGTFNEKGWDAMKALSQADREKALRLLFDGADGAAFTFGRVPIGSSDYALNRYSLNETAGDYEMTSFSIAKTSSPTSRRLLPCAVTSIFGRVLGRHRRG